MPQKTHINLCENNTFNNNNKIIHFASEKILDERKKINGTFYESCSQKKIIKPGNRLHFQRVLLSSLILCLIKKRLLL